MTQPTNRRDAEILAEIDPKSVTFRAIMELLANRQVGTIQRLKTVGMDQAQTEGFRGALREQDYLIGLDKELASLPARPITNP